MSTLNAALASVRDRLHSNTHDSSTASSSRSSVVESARPSAKSLNDGGGGGIELSEEDEASPILVFCRIRPSRGNAASKQLLALDAEEKRVEFNLPKASDGGIINNSRESYKFNFNGLFDQDTTQEQMFDSIGKRVVDNVLAGYNGTVFAYGQTGSGKTYTMVGGGERYEDRGLVPRSLSYIFDWIQSNSSKYHTSVFISYLEIYNDKGYDLLDPEHETKNLEELQRVHVMDVDGALHFKGLGEFPASNVDEALNLLFVGDTARVVCETPSNDASTRSHCIFMVSLEMREINGSKIRRSKLNLVDLAGSERVKQTGVGGKILNEALHINVSLHHLEQCIVALHDVAAGKATHVPYRNSMLTNVLRSSLGGNCRTVMVATLSPEKSHLLESVSTSRFAERVAMIKNKAILNEETDPYVLVKKLKANLRELQEEISMLKGETSYKLLSDDERNGLRNMIQTFVHNDRDPQFEDESGGFLQLPMPNPYKVRAAFEIWKELLLAGGGGGGGNTHAATVAATSKNAPTTSAAASTEETLRLQRENALLVEFIQRKFTPADAEKVIRDIKHKTNKGGSSRSSDKGESQLPSSSRGGRDAALEQSKQQQQAEHAPPVKTGPTPEEIAQAKIRAEAFENFRRSYRKHSMVEEQKAAHAQKVEQARSIGEKINQLRTDINSCKARIESHRISRGVAQLQSGGVDETMPPDAEELRLRAELEQSKSSYRQKFEQLKQIKIEVDFLKNVVEKSRIQLQHDFERFWATQTQGQNVDTNQPQPKPQQQQQQQQQQPQQSMAMASQSEGLISGSASIAMNSASSNPSRSSNRSFASTSSGPPAAPISAWGNTSGSVNNSNATMPGGLRTTGNSAADADISRFYAMKEELLRQREKQLQQQQQR